MNEIVKSPKKSFFRKKKTYFIILAVILVAIGSYFWYARSKSANQKVQYVTTTAKKGIFTASVSASGSIIVEQSASVDPDIKGTVSNLSVSVGDQVKKGQLLFNIVNDQLGIDVNKGKTSYVTAQAAVDSAKASLKSIKKNDTSLHENKLSAEKKLDAAKQNLANSLASLNYTKQQADKRNVISPINGTVNKVKVKNGDNLGASSSTHVAPIIIGDLSTLEAQVQVNEVDIPNVKVGQKATLTFDALPEFTDTGKVISVDALGTTTQGVVTYNVTISLDSLDPRIKPDMSVNATIITSAKEGVVTVPLSAVKTQNGKTYVEVLKNNVLTRVTVQTGASNDTDTQIISGINAGDKVVTQTVNPNASTPATTSKQRNNRNFRFIGG